MSARTCTHLPAFLLVSFELMNLWLMLWCSRLSKPVQTVFYFVAGLLGVQKLSVMSR